MSCRGDYGDRSGFTTIEKNVADFPPSLQSIGECGLAHMIEEYQKRTHPHHEIEAVEGFEGAHTSVEMVLPDGADGCRCRMVLPGSAAGYQVALQDYAAR